MRRSEKEITDRGAIEAIIAQAKVCRLGLCVEDEPYVVPVCFGYRNGRVYFHSATEGRKLDMLARNDRVCVEFEADCELIPADSACGWSMHYRSVVGTGRARLLDTIEAKRAGLDVIMAQYGGSGAGIADQTLDRVAVFEISLDTMTGKASGYTLD